MGTKQYVKSEMSRALGSDPARYNRTGTGDGNQLSWGIVGHEDPNPEWVRIENGQPWVEVTMKPEGDEIVARLALPDAGNAAGWYMPLTFGCRVMLSMVDGDPNDAAIVGRLWDEQCPMPGDVAGVSTGAAGKTGQSSGPAPAWQFIRTSDGQMLAIETGTNGDIVIHSAGSLLIKTGSAGAVQIDGTVHLGTPALTEPTGATVGPAGATVPGTPAIPSVPVPFVPTPETTTPTYVPYVGNEDAIIRAKEPYQFSAATDPVNYALLAAVFAHPTIMLPPPLALISQSRNATGSSGSKHTASD